MFPWSKKKLIDRMNHKREAVTKLEALGKEEATIRNARARISAGLHHVHNKVAAHRSAVERHEGGEQKAQYARLLRQAESELREAIAEQDRLGDRLSVIEKDKLALMREVTECDRAGADAKEVASHSAELQKAKEEVARLDALIAEQESALLAYSESDEERIEALLTRREEVLADLALGRANKSELSVVDSELKTLLDDDDGHEEKRLVQYRTISQTIAGLRRRREAAIIGLDALGAKTTEIVQLFLRSQAAEAGEEYLRTSQATVHALERLHALDYLFREVSGGTEPVFLPNEFHRTHLPVLNMPCFEAVKAFDKEKGVLYAASHPDALKSVDSERERLRSIGLQNIL